MSLWYKLLRLNAPIQPAIRLTPEEIDALPIREVTADDLYDLMGEVSYYTIADYPACFIPEDGELGYDALRQERYRLKVAA